MKIKVEMLESDIIRAMKNNQYSPFQLAVSRILHDDPDNVEINYDSVIVWNDDINDYNSYRYCEEDIEIIKGFLNEWNDYADGNLIDFCLSPISFCMKEKKIKLHT